MASTTYICAYCGTENETEVDESAGRRQRYVEDCQICCRPNLLSIEMDENGEPTINAEPENG